MSRRRGGRRWWVLLLLDGLAGAVGAWSRFWWALLAVDFALLVVSAQRLEPLLGPRGRERLRTVLAWGFPVLVLLAWEAIVRAEILNPRWFPPPTSIAGALWDLTVNFDEFNETSLIGRPWLIPQRALDEGWPGVRALFVESHVWATLGRVFGGFVLGSVPGVLIGVLMGLNRTVRSMLDATMSAVYVLPKIAIFPILMLVFPDPFGEGPKIAVVAISAFFLVAINSMAGVQGIDPVFLQAGRNFGAGRLQMLRHVILPGAMPIVFSGLRLALGTSLIVIVAVEFIRAQTGVGFVVFYHWQVLSTPKMYAGLVVVMALGVGLTALLQWAERRVMPWRRG
ncbi:MAG: ABC transporter permease [Trueperaceae bacterium]|nr:ABC transporter permease [Trueperaceae bacterium]